MTTFEKILNYSSILIIILVGVLFVSGFLGVFETTYQIGFGIVIIAYGVIRLVMTYYASQRRGKKP